MDFNQIGNILSSVLVIVAVFLAAWGALNRETLKTVRESNKDLIERVDILEKAQAISTASIVRLGGENDVLRSVVTGETTLVALGVAVHSVQSSIDSHHLAAEKWIATLDRHLVDLIKLTREGKP